MDNCNTQKLIWLPQALDPVTKKCPIYIGSYNLLHEDLYSNIIIKKISEEDWENLPQLIKSLKIYGYILSTENDEEDIEEEDITLKKHTLIDDSGNTRGFLYFTSGKYFQKIEHEKLTNNITALVSHYSDHLYALRKSWDKSDLILFIFSKKLMSVSEKTDWVSLNRPQEYFLLKAGELNVEDIRESNGIPIIINPEKIIPKDYENRELRQKLQIFFRDNQLIINDHTTNEINTKIWDLINKNILMAIKEN